MLRHAKKEKKKVLKRSSKKGFNTQVHTLNQVKGFLLDQSEDK